MSISKATIDKIATHPLQTSAWGEFRKAWGNDVVYTKYGLITLTKVPKTKYKIGTFIRGPKPTKSMLEELKKLGKKENLIFIKLEPNDVVEIRNKSSNLKSQISNLLYGNGCIPGKTLFTPTTFQIDLTPSEENLLKSFHSKTRYNIRLAQRKGVNVVEDNSNKAFEKYIKLTRQTVERQGFYAHTEKYHRLMWEYLHKRITNSEKPARNVTYSVAGGPIARLLTASYQGEIITTWIVFVHKDTLYYPYGASSSDPKYRNLMANNLMMWEAICFGKSLGLKTFDLWGREEGKGFTKFKEGYNPRVVEFIGTWDLVTSPLYYPFKVADKLRWAALRTKSKFSKPDF